MPAKPKFEVLPGDRQRGKPLSIEPGQVLKILQRKRGRLYLVPEILIVLKEDPDIGDNRAAVIDAACRLVDGGKCESKMTMVDGFPRPSFMVPAPKEDAPATS